MGLPAFIQPSATGVRLQLKVQPRASRDAVGEPEGTELKVWVTAPPVDSAANEAVCRLLAETLECRRGAVVLVRGASARKKVVEITGLTAEQVVQKLTRA
ncbi:MAG: DUF167 domain-containing protein [Verrucomicrobiales bacterium]|nr:DUF167 domain-containing protein [Verrucomicrobiales bacterium]